ncbi:MAG: 16S rRNA (guanine(966)-N(2))-methyltransferase RsmD [bacterium]
MRVVGGYKKGQRLKVPRKGIRPTKSIVREAIFNIIRDRIQEAKILDIFAGSGALGIESLSRGAAHCVFIEKRIKILAENIERMLLKDHAEIIRSDYRVGLMQIKNRNFDIIFLDPPYHENHIEKALDLISSHKLLCSDGMIIAEHSPNKHIDLPNGLMILKKKRYGDTAVMFIIQRNADKGEV